jgi:LPS sulfotransferase NodH
MIMAKQNRHIRLIHPHELLNVTMLFNSIVIFCLFVIAPEGSCDRERSNYHFNATYKELLKVILRRRDYICKSISLTNLDQTDVC